MKWIMGLVIDGIRLINKTLLFMDSNKHEPAAVFSSKKTLLTVCFEMD